MRERWTEKRGVDSYPWVSGGENSMDGCAIFELFDCQVTAVFWDSMKFFVKCFPGYLAKLLFFFVFVSFCEFLFYGKLRRREVGNLTNGVNCTIS